MAKPTPLFVFVAAIFCSTAIVFAQEQAPAPSYKEGDTWQFNISRKEQLGSSTEDNKGMYELSFNQGAMKLYDINGGQKREIAIQPDGPTQELLSLVGKSDQRLDLKFPLSVGQKWTYQFVYRPPGAKFNQHRSAEVNVTGVEEVTIPAGSFKAYKLIRSESWTSSRPIHWTGATTTTYFYSPETRSIVKSTSLNDKYPATVESELIKFTPGN